MALTRAEVQHIADLADLALSPEEISRLTEELGAILRHVEQLQELDTREVPPTAHLGASQMPLRPDAKLPGLSQERALEAGPRVNAGGFAVPRFVDE